MAWGGEYYDEKRSVDDLMTQTPKAMVLMTIILVAMFSAYRQPFIILVTLPLASIGIVWSLLLLDKPFGFMAIVGMICLSGMIIKNGIVLIDQIELERKGAGHWLTRSRERPSTVPWPSRWRRSRRCSG